jgi:uncharacterized membrane protein
MNIKQLLLSGMIMIILDYVYLTTFSEYYNKVVKHIQGEDINFNIIGAILCYCFLIFGINYFIIDQKKTSNDAFLLGIVIYGVFETTNYAIFKNWTIVSVLLDTLWGGVLFASITYLMTIVNS